MHTPDFLIEITADLIDVKTNPAGDSLDVRVTGGILIEERTHLQDISQMGLHLFR